MALLDGKKIASSIRKEVKERVAAFEKAHGRAPALSVVLVGEDAASQIYVRNKGRACKKTGITSQEFRLPESTSEKALLDLIDKLDQIRPEAIIQAIDPDKDVDGFHPQNVGALVSGRNALRSCTPLGCMKLLDEAKVDLVGANAVVVGRSITVGKPVSLMLLERHATVTICHSRTRKLAHVVAEADVVIAAVGSPELIKGEWVKRGATIIDVGINRLDDGRIVGDVEFDTAVTRASWITPVPGGVGPMTIACLVSNTVEAAERRKGV